MTTGRNLIRGSCDVAFHVFKSSQEVGSGVGGGGGGGAINICNRHWCYAV